MNLTPPPFSSAATLCAASLALCAAPLAAASRPPAAPRGGAADTRAGAAVEGTLPLGATSGGQHDGTASLENPIAPPSWGMPLAGTNRVDASPVAETWSHATGGIQDWKLD